jgi:hypothetical protein
VAIWLGLPLALVSAVILSWAYVREQSAVAALCVLSLTKPIRTVRILLHTRAWMIGFVAETGSWLVYFSALLLAPLALVQSVAASGVAVLALFQARGQPSRLARGEQVATGTAVIGLALLGLSLVGSHPSDRMASPFLATVWLGGLIATAVAVTLPRFPFSRAAISGLGAGLLFAVGDLSTKLVGGGGIWLVMILPLIFGYAFGSFALQAGFQQGSALVTAGVASLVSNAVPITAGIALFHERLPHGPLLDLRVLAYGLLVLSAALLVRPPLHTSGFPSTANGTVRSTQSGPGRRARRCGAPESRLREGTEAMTDAETIGAMERSQRNSFAPRDPNHPLPMWPLAHVNPEPPEISATDAKATARDGQESDDSVEQLAKALRTAERAHGAYLSELRLGDVEPSEDWSTWYAEYLLGQR